MKKQEYIHLGGNTWAVKLNGGKLALFDGEDVEKIGGYRWSAAGKPTRRYAMCTRIGLYMHRLITAAPRGMTVDHSNHSTLDNRKSNLRLVTQRINNQNHKGKSSSRFVGVRHTRVKSKGKWYSYWRAQIGVDGKLIDLGNFPDTPEGEIEAAEAYRDACLELGLGYSPPANASIEAE